MALRHSSPHRENPPMRKTTLVTQMEMVDQMGIKHYQWVVYFYEEPLRSAVWCFGQRYCRRIKSEAIQALVDTAKDLGASGRDDVFGHGLIQIDDALQSLQCDGHRRPSLAIC